MLELRDAIAWHVLISLFLPIKHFGQTGIY
jgi:hypothetical protein